MKRIPALLMAVSMLLCLVACGKPADNVPEQPPQQAETSDPPAQTEPPALEGEALSVLPAEDAGLTEGGYDAYREEDPMAEIVLLPTHSVTDFHYFIVGFREGGDQLTLTREDDLYTADALSPDRPLLPSPLWKRSPTGAFPMWTRTVPSASTPLWKAARTAPSS